MINLRGYRYYSLGVIGIKGYKFIEGNVKISG